MNIYAFILRLLAGLLFIPCFARGGTQDVPDLFRRQCAFLAQNAEKTRSMAVVGSDNWLFLAAELRHISAGQFWGETSGRVSRATKPEAADPLPAILDFNDQLKKIGVKLLVVPVPPKAVVYSEMLPGFTNQNAMTRLDRFHQEFYALLRSNDVAVCDLTDCFLQKKNDPQSGKAANEITVGRALGASPSSSGHGGTSQAKALPENLYCRQDSHWSGNGCVLAAEKIAAEVRPFLSKNDRPADSFKSDWRTIEISGDLWRSLNNKNIPKEKLRIRKIVKSGSNEPVEPDAESKIILLGDSHNLVFHTGDDMLFSGAGLPDQLAFELGAPLDLVAVRGSGATPARINLMRRARQNKDYWVNKKLVIWCFAAREFTESDGWRKVPIE